MGHQSAIVCLALLLVCVTVASAGNCKDDGSKCDGNSVCHDVSSDPDGYQCICKAGYVGNGKSSCESIFNKTHELLCTEGAMKFTYNKGSSITNLKIHVLKNGAAEHSANLLKYGASADTNSSCGTDDNTGSNLAVELDYIKCAGDAISTKQTEEMIQRIAVVEVAEAVLHASIRRANIGYSKYRLTCTYKRKRTVTGTFEETGAIPTIDVITKEDESTFELNMKFYEAGFDSEKSSPMTVALDEPIYVGINKVNEDSNLKMVIQSCWATDTKESDAKTFMYLFISDRCGLDNTYRSIEEVANTFRFQVNSFRFIQMKRNVFLHCSVQICKTDSALASCQFGCASTRKRRSIESEQTNEVVVHSRLRRNAEDPASQTITSPLIKYMEKETCEKKTCPANSQCVRSFPAFCRCNAGYVMHYYLKQCSNQTVFSVANFRMDLTYYSGYSDTTSMPFLELAHRFEQRMLKFYLTEKKIGITGLKVTKMTTEQGKVIFQVAFIRDPLISEAEVVQRINALHQTDSVVVHESIRVIPQTYIVPYSADLTTSSSKKNIQEESNMWVVVAAVTGPLCILLMLVLLVIFLRKRNKIVIAGGDAKKNQAFEMDA